MATDPRHGFHNWRYGFYNGKSGERLETLQLHLTSFDTCKPDSQTLGLCLEPMDRFASQTTVNVATRINKQTVCKTCQTLAEKEI